MKHTLRKWVSGHKWKSDCNAVGVRCWKGTWLLLLNRRTERVTSGRLLNTIKRWVAKMPPGLHTTIRALVQAWVPHLDSIWGVMYPQGICGWHSTWKYLPSSLSRFSSLLLPFRDATATLPWAQAAAEAGNGEGHSLCGGWEVVASLICSYHMIWLAEDIALGPEWSLDACSVSGLMLCSFAFWPQ